LSLSDLSAQLIKDYPTIYNPLEIPIKNIDIHCNKNVVDRPIITSEKKRHIPTIKILGLSAKVSLM